MSFLYPVIRDQYISLLLIKGKQGKKVRTWNSIEKKEGQGREVKEKVMSVKGRE